MDKIKSITFDKEAQDNLPQHIKDKMKADRDNARKKTKNKGLNIPIVTKHWLFWFESEGKEGYTFEIEAKDSNNAYDKAYDSYGPQVAGMMYQII